MRYPRFTLFLTACTGTVDPGFVDVPTDAARAEETAPPPAPTTPEPRDAPVTPGPSTDATAGIVDAANPVDAGHEASAPPVVDATAEGGVEADAPAAGFYCYLSATLDARAEFQPCDLGTGAPGWYSVDPFAPCTADACPVGAACTVPAHGLIPSVQGVCR